jgi:3D (Asp-Asp-Asp) domain-containing protein
MTPRPVTPILLLALPLLLLQACQTRKPLPKFQRPIARAKFQTVRTTAYTHSESDHIAYGRKNALGTDLQFGPKIHSAAADWARWPAGTTFRITNTGEHFIVDDYGWALAGTNTIDLYKPTKSAMNKWGVRNVQIEILQWGDVRNSQRILSNRKKSAHKFAHIRRMDKEIDRFYFGSDPIFRNYPNPMENLNIGAPSRAYVRD